MTSVSHRDLYGVDNCLVSQPRGNIFLNGPQSQYPETKVTKCSTFYLKQEAETNIS